MSDDEFEASTPYGRYRQTEVFTTGMLTGETPDVPVSFEALKAAAEDAMSDDAYGYVAGGAGGESTMRGNRDAFEDYRLVPRVLRDTSARDLAVDVLGQEWSVPVALAPIGVQGVVHDDGDLASARAAAAEDVPYVTSTQSSYPLEAIADELDADADDAGPNWFQLYWSTDRDVTASLVDRAEAAGYDAICLTLDTPHLGWRERDLANGYLPFLEANGIANYTSDPAFRDRLDADPDDNPRAAAREFVEVFADPTLEFDDLEWLFERTDLPVVCKGVLHPADARRCVTAGADGVVVSNHGGRQVDRAVAALDQLPRIADVVRKVDPDAAVLFDSGIRRGADVVVALALGADAVLLGRPYCYGLALDGAAGVRAVVTNLRADLDLAVALTGHTAARDVDEAAITRTNQPS
jgi:isopentenyl-diphosphate delta-isomerase